MEAGQALSEPNDGSEGPEPFILAMFCSYSHTYASDELMVSLHQAVLCFVLWVAARRIGFSIGCVRAVHDSEF